MNKFLVTNDKKQLFKRYGLIALALTMFIAFAASFGILPAMAANDKLAEVMNVVIGLVTDVALYVGIIILVWGIFQAVMAFRREDSEGMSKQFITIAVGAILLGLGAIVGPLVDTLTGGEAKIENEP